MVYPPLDFVAETVFWTLVLIMAGAAVISYALPEDLAAVFSLPWGLLSMVLGWLATSIRRALNEPV